MFSLQWFEKAGIEVDRDGNVEPPDLPGVLCVCVCVCVCAQTQTQKSNCLLVGNFLFLFDAVLKLNFDFDSGWANSIVTSNFYQYTETRCVKRGK